MARRFAQKKQLFDVPDEKNDDATAGCDNDGENKKGRVKKIFCGGSYLP